MNFFKHLYADDEDDDLSTELLIQQLKAQARLSVSRLRNSSVTSDEGTSQLNIVN